MELKMDLETLIVKFNGKKAIIEIDDDGIFISAEDGEESEESDEEEELITLEKDKSATKFTAHELHYLCSVAFVYLGSHIKDHILPTREILKRGHKFYDSFHKRIKSISDMSGEEVGKYIHKCVKKYYGK